ncbi:MULTISPECIES: hypothetical protein [unclassified Pseudodesulfovibrio]|uniref:hypothetical protein n=1 Tax=unclassified Pseudodesulfovibrio TaxID=2661612 RepID=UPI000FEB6EDB|nr:MULTISPECIES: hypothetical protein [unclassified Pseudodesulfovibrio]MCJ2165970.1 hypothetical protein [Pseudodesulfovibrio sp. S3-i]RWU02592.1 hypothetical protein DWB63_15535 [Pseudodesulfovibrio sp. S3]
MVSNQFKKAAVDMAGHLIVAGVVFGLCYWWFNRMDFPIICSAIIIAGGIKNSIMTFNYEKRCRQEDSKNPHQGKE